MVGTGIAHKEIITDDEETRVLQSIIAHKLGIQTEYWLSKRIIKRRNPPIVSLPTPKLLSSSLITLVSSSSVMISLWAMPLDSNSASASHRWYHWTRSGFRFKFNGLVVIPKIGVVKAVLTTLWNSAFFGSWRAPLSEVLVSIKGCSFVVSKVVISSFACVLVCHAAVPSFISGLWTTLRLERANVSGVKELQDLLKIAVNKSILCEHLKVGQCAKGFKCKFSHDLNIQRKGKNWSRLFSPRVRSKPEESHRYSM
ncbi:hypothetical protein OROHE_014509 [Orobanche hederae]